jgi:Ala-tRNA(Pro) deacylase
MMTPDELLALLDRMGVAHETVSHAPVFRVDESDPVLDALPGAHTKNLFLKDAKGRLWLVSAEQHAVVDLKALPAAIGSARLSFGSAERLWDALGVRPGSVSALALANDAEHRVSFVLDKTLAEAERVNFHPLANHMTSGLSQGALRLFLEKLGVRPLVIDLETMSVETGR